jgi:hypothetical protein
MALTRDFKETIQERARRDAAFREALLKEAVDALLSGDVDTGKTVLRDYINGRIRQTSECHEIAQEPHAHARPERQSSSSQCFRDRRLFTEKGRSALESARDVGLAAYPLAKIT